jgi:hypothetical protein
MFGYQHVNPDLLVPDEVRAYSKGLDLRGNIRDTLSARRSLVSTPVD